MANADPILLGGGVAKGAPFSLGAIQLVQSVTPGSIADSIIWQRLAGATIVITIGTDQYPTATETVKIIGGLISDVPGGNGTVLIGQEAQAVASVNGRNVVIGYQAKANVTSGGSAVNLGDNIVIGSLASLTWGIGGSVIIGSGATVTTAAPVVGAGVVLIGANANISTPTGGLAVGLNAHSYGQCVIVGYGANVSGNFDQSVAVGSNARLDGINAVALGDGARAHAGGIAIGRAALTTQGNQLAFGSLQSPISQVLVGGGNLAAGGQAVLYRHTNAAGGNDDPAGNIQYQAGLGTGADETGGRIQFLTGIPHGTDAIVQTAQVVFEILPTTGGAGKPVVSFPVYTSGAGAGAGTLGNAPSAGNPSEWIPVRCKGNLRYIPAWT